MFKNHDHLWVPGDKDAEDALRDAKPGDGYTFNSCSGLTRTKAQNRYLWSWLYEHIERQMSDGGIVIVADNGERFPYTKEVLHEVFRVNFLVKKSIKKKGKELILYYSTTEITKPRFSEFVRDVKKMVYERWEIVVPPTPAVYKRYL